MLAGLIFATADADDRPDKLAATLPFGGATLIEFQARQLIAQGASQLLVAVSRLTPELLGAINRLRQRKISIDTVRSAAEAVEQVHPLARVVVMADALVTSDAVVGLIAQAEHEALLVTGDDDALPGFERVGADALWAGLAIVDSQRFADAARLPADYDFQSTLLRVAAQAEIDQIALPGGRLRDGHAIERDSRALEARGSAALAAIVANRPTWFDRFVLAPVARRALPPLVARAVPTQAIGAGAAVVALGGMAALATGWPVTGLALALLSVGGFALGGVLARLRGESRFARLSDDAVGVVAAASTLLLGHGVDLLRGTATGIVLAIILVWGAVLVERAVPERQRRLWWASPAVYPLLLLAITLVGYPLIALAAGAGYAGITLTAAVEQRRQEP